MAFIQKRLDSPSQRPLGQQKRVAGAEAPAPPPPPPPSPTALAYHISMGVEYSVDPSSTSGGLYHRVTTSLE